MGNRSTKSSLRNAIIYLNISADPVCVNDDKFWTQIWSEDTASAAEIIKSISTQEIRMLRDGSPKNFATLTYKMVERLCLATGTLCNMHSQQTAVRNATKILIRLIPCIFEDKAWRKFFSDNYIHTGSNGTRKEVELVYPKKSDQEKDFKSYLPAGIDTRGFNSAPAEEPDDEASCCGERTNSTTNSSETNDNKHKSTSSNATVDVGPTIDLDEGDELLGAQRSPCCGSEGLSLGGELAKEQAKTKLEQSKAAFVEAADRNCDGSESLMKALVLSICDLLFCPEFTVPPHAVSYLSNAVDAPPEDLKSLVTCDYVWEPGVGFDSSANSTTYYDKSRSELLRLLLACLSTTLYERPNASISNGNNWIEIFASTDNRHALPLFTSLLNTVFIYNPSKLLPFNHLLFEDTREELVELSIQILTVTLDYQFNGNHHQQRASCARGDNNRTSNGNGNLGSASNCGNSGESARGVAASERKNLFIEYMSRIHRNEDFVFLIKGFTRLLNTHLEQGYLLSSTKHINFDQELLILFWRICNLNRKFIGFFLKTTDILSIVLPILYHLNENFQDTTKTALIHIGVFNLLILSGERNFGVRLNKPYMSNVLLNLPAFTGSHADLMIIIFHKLILYGQNLNQLFDFMLTIIVNISPYLKALSMLASKCLIQLFEIFSSACVVLTEPNYHQLVVFLLEIFNNLIQYQFDGNANLVYTILNKREAFLNLANMPTTTHGIQKVLNKLIKKKLRQEQLAAADAGPDQRRQQQLGGCSNEEERRFKDEAKLEQGCQNVNNQQPQSTGCCREDAEMAIQSEGYRNCRPGSSATVSFNRLPSEASNCRPTKQEVELVATPDICHVTQPIHPFRTIESAGISSDVFFASSPGAETPPLSFDDILNEGPVDLQASAKQSSNSNGLEQATINGLETPDYEGNNPQRGSGAVVKSGASVDGQLTGRGQQNSMERQTRSPALSTSDSIYVMRERWRPTPDWVKQWKQSLPLHTTLRMIEVLTPQLERLNQNRNTSQPDELEMIKFLQNGTLVGLLPVPHPILIRKYRTNSGTTLWFRACTWGIIYVRNTIWTDTKVRLVKIV